MEYRSNKTWSTIQLAEAYGVDSKRIKSNLDENKNLFAENTDYFVLQREELRKFRVEHDSLLPQNKPKVSLWTISGAMKHAELVNTLSSWSGLKSLIDIMVFDMNLSNGVGYTELRDMINRFEAEVRESKEASKEAKMLSLKVLERVLKLEEKLKNTDEKADVMASDIAIDLGLYTKHGSPHCQLVGAMAKTLKMPIHTYDKYEDENIKIVPDQSNIDGYWQVFYKTSGVQKIIEWFNTNKFEIEFKEYYRRNTVNKKKGDLKGHGYKVNGKHYWLKI